MRFQIRNIKKKIHKIHIDEQFTKSVDVEQMIDIICTGYLKSNNPNLWEVLKIEYMLENGDNGKENNKILNDSIDKYIKIAVEKELFPFVSQLYKLKSLLK